MKKKRTRKKKLSLKDLHIKSLLLDNSLVISVGMIVYLLFYTLLKI